MKILSSLVIFILFTSGTWSFSIFKDNSKEDEAKGSGSSAILNQLDAIKIDKKLPGFTPQQIKCKLGKLFLLMC